jgi:hypothetical protein
MHIYPANFDKLHFTECSLGTPAIDGDTFRIPVSGLFVLRGHPLLAEGDGPHAGFLVFKGVTHSLRDVIEYIGDPRAPQGFKSPYRVEDAPFPQSNEHGQIEYGFEGLQLTPCAWIDNWVVRADSFELHVES